MSTTTFLLLFLLYLGVSAAKSQSSDGSEFFAKSFADLFRNALDHKKMTVLEDMISNSFIFSGCSKRVNKRELLKTLHNLPVGVRLIFEFKSSQFIASDHKRIGFVAVFTEFGYNHVANFVLDSGYGDWKLFSGNVPKCPSHFEI